MSDVVETTQGAAVPAPATAAAKAAEDQKKKEQAEQALVEILKLMELPARLEVKDGSDGGISVAIFLETEVPGIQAGRRSHLVDALQFLVNKIVNRPNTERRWISIGVGGHPEPRAQKPAAPAPAPAAKPAAPPAQRPQSKPQQAQRPNGQQSSSPRPVAAAEPDEATLQVSPDPAIAQLAQALAEKSARLGRFYAVASMNAENRARLLSGATGVAGVKVRAEGEGRSRRVVFAPDKPTPMPNQKMPNFDDEEEELD
jgi:predicted RNA-binding protein Jag